MKFLVTTIMAIGLLSSAYAQAPDLRALKGAGEILHSEVSGYEVDPGWTDITKVMAETRTFDRIAARMMAVFCSDKENKSVLLVGEPSDTYTYIFARLAQMATPEGCARLSHFNMDTSKLQGYMYVGTTERAWQDYVEKPAYNKDIIMYFSNLALLIGTGTSSNKPVGIESTYVQAISTGKLKSVAFLNKYDYNRLTSSKDAYVVNAFQETIQIDELAQHETRELVDNYLRIIAPHVKFDDRMMNFMFKNIEYYQPNVLEPQRSVGILKAIIRGHSQGVNEKLTNYDVKTPNPYLDNMNVEYKVKAGGSSKMKIAFEYFETENSYDVLNVYDAKTNNLLDRLSGVKTDFKTKWYNTDELKLVFKTDSRNTKKGFKIAYVQTERAKGVDVNMEIIRSAIMQVVQVPAWIVRREYDLVRELPALLDDDVVGVIEGKKAVVKQFKIGYVSGRTDEKPAGSMLFVGSTGTGKSYIAKKAAEFMQMKMITIDMTQYSSINSFDRFLDAVSNNLVLYPYAVYLFEEIDKANPKVLDRLFFMMDEGIFYDKSQRPLFARGAMIMMTTNAGHDVIVKHQHDPNLKEIVYKSLLEHYRPSFLNRFDSIPIFTPFTASEFQQLASIMISKKIKKMRENFGWELSVSDEVIAFCGENGGSKLLGARPMERLIENVISVGISEYQLMVGNLTDGQEVTITKLEEDLMFRVTSKGQSTDFEVDLNNNSGSNVPYRIDSNRAEIQKFLETIRMY